MLSCNIEYMKRRVLTGDRPTGKLHLGHYVGSLANRIALQNDPSYEQFVMIADVQALSAHTDINKVRDSVIEVALDYLAVGLDPRKTTIFIQSLIPQIPELTMYFLNLVTVSRLAQNPTVKTEMKEKGFEKSVPAGFFMHPVNQTADILAFKADVVPVGADQLPMIEQANEIGERFNRTYGSVFPHVQAMVPEAGKRARLPGIDGKSKMSKSLDNAIYLSDSRAEIERKVMMMYTDPGHVHVQDPGKVEGNAVFMYLDVFDSDIEEVRRLKKQYRAGGLGDMVLKKRLIEILDGLIAPMRERRAAFAKDKKGVLEILIKGSKKAEKIATQTLAEARRALSLDY